MSVFFLVNKIDDISGPGAVVAIGIQGENLAQIGKRVAPGAVDEALLGRFDEFLAGLPEAKDAAA